MNLCKEINCYNEKAPGRSRCWTHYGEYRRGTLNPSEQYYPGGMRILYLDLETTPTLAWTWGLHQVDIGINQIVQEGGMMCFAAKWQGQKEIEFYSEWDDGHEKMVLQAWRLLDSADVIVHWNGTSFDRKHLNREFLLQGLAPPSNTKNIDLLLTARKNFRFISNKLDFVSQQLGLPGKMEHEGFPLWTRCMNRDPDALQRMQAYNEQDTILLEDAYEILLPWIPGHPSRLLYEQGEGCPTCGASSESLVEAGYYCTAVSRFPQFRCLSCQSCFRSSKRDFGVSVQGVGA